MHFHLIEKNFLTDFKKNHKNDNKLRKLIKKMTFLFKIGHETFFYGNLGKLTFDKNTVFDFLYIK